MRGVGLFYERLLDKPSIVDTDFCAICGRPAIDKHHVIKKGMGGYSKETEKRIPQMRLCGFGNTSGCHGLMHKGRLHVYWDESMGGWVFWVSPEPMKDFDAWYNHWDEFLPIPGWIEQQTGKLLRVFGSGKVDE